MVSCWVSIHSDQSCWRFCFNLQLSERRRHRQGQHLRMPLIEGNMELVCHFEIIWNIWTSFLSSMRRNRLFFSSCTSCWKIHAILVIHPKRWQMSDAVNRLCCMSRNWWKSIASMYDHRLPWGVVSHLLTSTCIRVTTDATLFKGLLRLSVMITG